MNIYSYIPSPDIANYCIEIGRIFNPLERAVIIASSNKTQWEKHMAWRELIAESPNMPIPQSMSFGTKDSLHAFLQELIAWEEGWLNHFVMPSENMVYRFRVLWKGQWHNTGSGVYTTFEKAWSSLWRHWEEDDQVSCIHMEKGWLDEDRFTQVEAYINQQGEVLQLQVCDPTSSHPGDLTMIFIDLPVPFKRGDLVTFDDGKPRVLECLPHWQKTGPGFGPRYEDRLSSRCSDGSDMVACYDFLDENGRLIRSNEHSYWNLRYYRGTLHGQDRFLAYLGEYIRNEEAEIDWLINVFLKFQSEAVAKDTAGLFGGWYSALTKEVRNDKDGI